MDFEVALSLVQVLERLPNHGGGGFAQIHGLEVIGRRLVMGERVDLCGQQGYARPSGGEPSGFDKIITGGG